MKNFQCLVMSFQTGYEDHSILDASVPYSLDTILKASATVNKIQRYGEIRAP